MRPFDSLPMRAAISRARVFIGCVAGRLFAYFSVNSAACALVSGASPVAQAAATDAVFRKERRDKWPLLSLAAGEIFLLSMKRLISVSPEGNYFYVPAPALE